MKKFIFIFLFFFVFIGQCCQAKTLKGNISLIDDLPNEFFGSWVVTSTQIYTNNPEIQKEPGIDYWNIYRQNEVLKLENPITNAQASVTINTVKNNTVTFTRKAKKAELETVEKPTITLNGENFFGIDKVVMKKYKNGDIIKTDVIEFLIIGTKIGGEPVQKILNGT